jgi:hypothetical protein
MLLEPHPLGGIIPMTSQDIYPLAQQLYTMIPAPLLRWTGEAADPDIRDRLAEALMGACQEAGLTNHEDLIIAEALAGFLTGWGCRYGNLDEDVDRAQTALVTSLGGSVLEPGHYALTGGTPMTVAAIAHLIGWVTILEVPEP